MISAAGSPAALFFGGKLSEGNTWNKTFSWWFVHKGFNCAEISEPGAKILKDFLSANPFQSSS